jgi:signal transduction histidine kinase
MVLACGVMVAFAIGTFAPLLFAIKGLHHAVADARRARTVLVSVHRLEEIMFDLEMDSRAFILIRDQRFLRSYDAARAAFDGQAVNLEQVAAEVDVHQGDRARQIVRADNAYVNDYSVPLMNTERTDPAGARARVVSGEGIQRLASLRDQLTRFTAAQRMIATVRERRSVAAARKAQLTALAVLACSLGMICFFVAYFTKVIVRPIRRASAMAGELADGDLSVRMPETSPGEIGMLENTFNTMAGSLETSRDTLRLVAEEQGALRRIATLVARGVTPEEVFTAVATEVGHVLGVDHTTIIRYEPDNTVTLVGYWNAPRAPKLMPPLDGRWPIEDGTVTAAVLTTGRPARMTDYEHATSTIGVWARSKGIRCVVGCPVSVDGRIWGAMLVHSLTAEAEPHAEHRMCKFVALVSAAIANAQGRSDLLASRARVVAAADESRRRIERKLHDGAQQQLVGLALKLRMMRDSLAPCQEGVRRELSIAVEDVNNALTNVQEISRGIAPSVLTAKGLPSALRVLAQRSPVPVELDVCIGRRLPENVETAIYYIVSEALTNAAKHAYACAVDVHIRMRHTTVWLSIRDDGVGGADPRRGTGLLGLRDRVEALGGRLGVVSPAGNGTSLFIDIPMDHGVAGG